MTLFEDLFGMWPDGGNGSLEIACIAILLAILAAPFLVRKIGIALRRSQAAGR